MRYAKRIILPALLLLTAVLLCFSPALAGGEGNLLYNGDFELIDAEGFPEGWYTDAYYLDEGFSTYTVTEDPEGEQHGRVAALQNAAKNDARFAQIVDVEPDTLYKLSGYIRADHIEGGHGANLSVEGVYAFSEKVFDTDGKWQYIEYYGETGPDQTELTVFARVGGYSGISKGSAWFDDLRLEKTDRVPGDLVADLWFVEEEYGDTEDDWEDWEDWEEEESDAPAPAWPMLLVLALVYIAGFLAVILYFRDGKRPCRGLPVLPFLGLALLLRLILSYYIEGYSVDVNCFLSWGHTMMESGPAEFYQRAGFCDYPPLYTYVLGLNSWLSQALSASREWTRVLFRFLPCLCDVAGCWMIGKLLDQEKKVEKGYASLIVILAAFNPVSVVNSAAWGQMDSVLCLLILGVALLAMKEKWIPAVCLYVTAVLVKPQALMLGFLGLAFMILFICREKENWKKILLALGCGVALMALYILPFGLKQQPGWLISQYTSTLSSYPYATVNTANLYYLLGGNWNPVGNRAMILAPLILAAAVGFHGVVWTLKNRGRTKAFWVESALSAVFTLWFIVCAAIGASWAWVGAAAMAYAFVIVLSLAIRKRDIRFLPYLGALLFILLYVFGVKMHERYLFPAFLLLLCAWACHRDRRILYLYLLFSFTVFLNEGIVLDNSIRLGSAMGHLNADTVVLADILSVINVAGAFLAVWLGYDLMKEREIREVGKIPTLLPVRRVQGEICVKPDRKLRWNRWDTLILCGITALYSVLTLTTLGSTKAPLTSWTSSGEDEQIIFDLGDYRENVRVLYFGQVSREDFTWSASEEMEYWGEEVYAQMDQGECWKWKYVSVSYDQPGRERVYYNSPDYIFEFSGRYLRLTSCQVGLTLNEVLFRDEEGRPIQASVVGHTGAVKDSVLYSDPANLLDEQDSMESLPAFLGGSPEEAPQPSWWNSTYFDEIYHARTAYEFTRHTSPYETSHPPLGKVFISWCISLFGMTPFGWRFAGALAGILMLPGIYLLAKQLTKKTWIAALGCGLMALDCMHLTQTQIATIDSFPVLFIIYAFFFMLRFVQTDLKTCALKEALLPLLFSGISIGLAIASKWIGIYAGAGLAVLYFWHCLRSIPRGGEGRKTLRKVLLISLWCILFFIVIPVAIYLASYLPYMAYNTRIKSFGDYVDAVWRAQQSMLSYHATPGLGQDHPFASPWYEWPIIGKPMYYSSEQYVSYDADLHYSIFCFGNPAVWWGALGAIVFVLWRWIHSKHYQLEGREQRWHLRSLDGDCRYGFTLVALLAQYLPWVGVPRGTYIYHYFACVPFLVMMLCLCFAGWKDSNKIPKIAAAVLAVAAAVLFVILLPYAAGLYSPESWLDWGKSILKIWY